MSTNLKPQGTLQALTEGDLTKREISAEDRAHLVAFTTQQLTLYVREIGGPDQFAELVDNIEGWRAGWNEAQDYYWCVPSTKEGFYIRGIGGGMAVFKWSSRDLRALVAGLQSDV